MISEKGHIYIISGPSGAGKSTVLSKVFQRMDRYYFSISATTRAPRPGETDGVNYHFVTRGKFFEMIEKGELLEHAEYVGNCYGTPLRPIYDHIEDGCDVFLDVEVKGNRQLRAKLPEAISIFITTPDLETLEQRLRDRGTETEEKIQCRLETARREMRNIGDYDHVIINDRSDKAADEILRIVKGEKN
ncbi:MAG: guanylate kinase [Oscillospiraceae bacterium]